MLTIDRTVYAALRRRKADAFVARMRDHLDGCSPGWRDGLADREAADRIRDEFAVAERFGIRRARDLRKFVEMAAMFGPGFHERLPWAARILADTDASASARIDRLERCALFEGGR